MKYQSITTPSIQHDAPNLLVEFMVLNKELQTEPFPWKSDYQKFWGKSISCIKKLIRDFDLTEDQLGWYIFRCRVTQIDEKSFAKAAVVAKKLFKEADLSSLREEYLTLRANSRLSSLDIVPYKKPKARKSLLEFLKDLENEEN